MRVAFLGLGLIGGSIARALRADDAHPWSLVAWSPAGTGPRMATEDGIIDAAADTPRTAIDGADIVVLAAPPIDCLDLLRQLGGDLRPSIGPDSVITDVASTKVAICSLADELGLPFVGGHPMAGREVGGFASSDAGLFRDRPWVVVPGAGGPESRVEALVDACDARLVRMSATEHDHAVAGISHLPLVLSAALVEAVAGRPGSVAADWPATSALAAGGWASMTRLARGDVEMGTGILATNAPEIANRLRDLRTVLDAWLLELDAAPGPDSGVVRARLAAARDTLRDGEA
jgi:prephenate dehydrogenase